MALQPPAQTSTECGPGNNEGTRTETSNSPFPLVSVNGNCVCWAPIVMLVIGAFLGKPEPETLMVERT